MFNFIKKLFSDHNAPVPGTLDDIIKQFDNPPKQKTQKDIIRDYQIRETMAKLEVDMLSMDPAQTFRGTLMWYDNQGNKYFDWVPCVVRPEVIYCSYGKS